MGEVSKVIADAEQLSIRGEGSELALENKRTSEASVIFGLCRDRKATGLRMRITMASLLKENQKFIPSCFFFEL
jgi:hypothetical protein